MTAEELKKAEEAKKAEELKKAEDAKAAEEAKKAEKTVTEEQLLKAIQGLEEFSKARKDVEEDDEPDPDELEDAMKSYSGNFEENETLEKAIEVSPFLEAIVGETSASIGIMGKEVAKLAKSMGEFDGKQIEALKAVSDVVKGLSTKIDEFSKSTNDRLTAIENTPAGGRKSITKAIAIEKSFGAGGGGEDQIATMPKRKIVDLLAKAVEDGKINPMVLFSFEGEQNYPLTDEHKDILKAYIKA